MLLISCEMDVRTGGSYRFVFGVGNVERMAFFGKYLDVTPGLRLVWTNEESGAEGSVTTATFEERDGKTLVVVRELHPSKEAFDASFSADMEPGTLEQHEQLDELLVTLQAAAT